MRLIKTLLIFVMLIGLLSAGVTVPEWELSKDSFRSGSSGIITMTLSNPGIYTMGGMGTVIHGAENVRISAPSSIVDLRPGATTSLALPFTIDEETPSGIYRIEIRFLGYEEDPSGSKLTVNSVVIPIKVVDVPELSLALDQTVIGGIDSTTLTISNKGGIAKNMKIKMDETSNIALYGTNEIFLDRVDNDVHVPLVLDSRDSEEGPVDLSFIIKYEDELGMAHEERENVRVTVKKDRLDLSFVQNNEITTKQEGTLTLEIKNNGAETLKDVRISFEDERMRLKEENEINAGDISKNGSVTVSAEIFADYPPGLNYVESTISWTEEDVEKTRSIDMPLTIQSDATVGVYLEAKPAPVTNHNEHTISVLVSNLGSHEISNVEVGVKSDAFNVLDISNRKYIGNLENDDFSTAQFKVMVDAASSGEYPLTVNIDFRDMSGEWRSDTVKAMVTVNEPIEEEDIDPVLATGLVAVLAVAIWHFKFRKKPEKR